MPDEASFTHRKISDEERIAIEQLGGFERVESLVNDILAQHGFLRGMFTAQERAELLRDFGMARRADGN